MDLGLKNKKALVSAGHKGIGFFIAKRLLEEGAEVSICCRRFRFEHKKADGEGKSTRIYL